MDDSRYDALDLRSQQLVDMHIFLDEVALRRGHIPERWVGLCLPAHLEERVDMLREHFAAQLLSGVPSLMHTGPGAVERMTRMVTAVQTNASSSGRTHSLEVGNLVQVLDNLPYPELEPGRGYGRG